MDIDLFLKRRLDRRNFLKRAGVAGAGAVGLTGFAANAAAQEMVMGVELSPELDAKILTFALNLEYLEAEYYLRGAYGLGLSSDDIGMNPGDVVGGRKVKFETPEIEQYAQRLLPTKKRTCSF